MPSDNQPAPASATEAQEYTFPFGRQHRWTRRLIALVVVLCALGAGFAPELRGVWWRMRHGNTVDFQGIRFRVPPLAYVLTPTENQIVVVRGTGFLRFKFAHASYQTWTLNYVSPELLARRGSGALFSIEQVYHVSAVGERRTPMLGAPLVCREYLMGAFRTIQCERFTPGPRPSYLGQADGEADFYRFLSSATSVAAPSTADAP